MNGGTQGRERLLTLFQASALAFAMLFAKSTVERSVAQTIAGPGALA